MGVIVAQTPHALNVVWFHHVHKLGDNRMRNLIRGLRLELHYNASNVVSRDIGWRILGRVSSMARDVH